MMADGQNSHLDESKKPPAYSGAASQYKKLQR